MSNPNKNSEKSNKNKNQQQNKKKQPPNKNANQGNKKNDKPNKGNVQDIKNQKSNKENVDKPKEVPIREAPKKVDLQQKIDNAPALAEENVENSTYGKYRKRKIETNWTKDELPENIYEKVEETSRGANMQELFNKPMLIGDHFQFKSEKHWNYGSLHPNDDELFMLDFKKIGEHVTCVPFYEQIELDPSLFAESQVDEMKKTAAKNKLLYGASSEKLNMDISILNSKICNILIEPINEKGAEGPVQEMIQEKNIIKPFKEIKIDSNITIQNFLPTTAHHTTDNKDTSSQNVKEKVESQVATEEESQEDLEEWLNDYLG